MEQGGGNKSNLTCQVIIIKIVIKHHDGDNDDEDHNDDHDDEHDDEYDDHIEIIDSPILASAINMILILISYL